MNDSTEPLPDAPENERRPRREPALRLVQPGEAPPIPCSAEAEEHVLACCLIDEGATLARCGREKLTAEAFYFPASRKIFEVLLAMQQAGRAITLEVLAAELTTRREFEGVGGWPYLMQVTGKVSTTAHAGYFIEKVRELWVLRRLRLCGQALVEDIDKFTGGLEDLACRHTLRLQRWADFVVRLNRPGLGEEMTAARAQLEQILAGKVDKSRQLSLGTSYADEVLLKLDVKNEDWFVVVCAPPSGGKSSYTRQVVGVNAIAGKRVVVFLLETGKRRWVWALAASLAGVNLRDVLEAPGRVPPDRLTMFLEWEKQITAMLGVQLWVYDDLYNVEDIERTTRELDRTLREQDQEAAAAAGRAPRGLDLAVIDYLQLMTTRDAQRIHKREEQVAYLSRSCKRLFKSLDITGIVLSQLNRKSRDEERRPRLSDLRESGAIEQDADCVLAVHTPAKDRTGAEQTGERDVQDVELISLKRRNGPANLAIDLLFFKSQTRYQDAPRKGDARPGAPKPATGYRRAEGGAA